MQKTSWNLRHLFRSGPVSGLCCVIPLLASWGHSRSTYDHKPAEIIQWPQDRSFFSLCQTHTPILSPPPPFTSDCFFHLCVCHLLSPISLLFHFTSLNTFSHFSSLSLALHTILGLSLTSRTLIQFRSFLLISLSLTLSYKHTQLSVCRAEQSRRKWILEGQFNMTGLGLREDCSADPCLHKCAWVCAYFWQRPHLMMLLVSLTDGS